MTAKAGPAADAKRLSLPRVDARASLTGLRASFLSLREKLAARGFLSKRALEEGGRWLVVGACAAGSVGLARLVETHVRKSPAFATKVLTVEGGSHLDRAAILAAAGLREGQNVFELSPSDVEARLAAHPWIAEADVERRLPATYRISIREQKPVAVLALDELYFVADDGTVFKRVADGDPVDLPVVTGIEKERFLGDRTYRASVMLEVVALLHLYASMGLDRGHPIEEVHVESAGAVVLHVGERAVEVRLGEAPFRQKLSRLRQVYARLEREHLSATHLFLDNESRSDRVTVRLETDAAPSEALANLR